MFRIPGLFAPLVRYRWPLAGGGLLVLLFGLLLNLVFRPEVPQEPVSASAPGRTGETVRNEPLLPLPNVPNLNPAKVMLGKQLFHDTRLSKDGSLSCASCHDLLHGGVDGLPHSRGVGGAEGAINAPTVFNASLNFRQFWDGRAATLEAQAAGPVTNPLEMATTWPEVVVRLKADRELARQFDDLYPDGLTEANVRSAIADFERTLLTPSRFDRWLRGDELALNEAEKQGYALFKKHGCIACHQGVNVGGNLYQRFGIMRDYFAGKGKLTDADLGRFSQTQKQEDRHLFKVPSLRNSALTAPYFHDASATTLEQAVSVMGLYQLGVTLPEADVKAIVTFLHSLTGEGLQ